MYICLILILLKGTELSYAFEWFSRNVEWHLRLQESMNFFILLLYTHSIFYIQAVPLTLCRLLPQIFSQPFLFLFTRRVALTTLYVHTLTVRTYFLCVYLYDLNFCCSHFLLLRHVPLDKCSWLEMCEGGEEKKKIYF